MKLFEPKPPGDHVKVTYSQSRASRMFASHYSHEAQIKRLLQEWFDRYPKHERSDLSARLQSEDDNQHLGAVFELYCYALLLAHGYDVEVHPDHVSNTSSVPDFLAKTDQTSLIIECVMPSDPSQDRGEFARQKRALDVIDGISVPGCVFRVHMKNIGPSDLQSSKVREEIAAWNSNHLKSDTGEVIPEPGQTWSWENDGWSFSIQLRSWSGWYDNDPTAGSIQALHYGAGSADPFNVLTSRLNRKRRKYGNLPYPYIIAVNSMLESMMVGDMELAVALYGSAALIGLAPIVIDTERLKSGTSTGGLWLGKSGVPVNRHVSAVLFVTGLAPETFNQRTPTLWHNPWAANPVDPNIWRGPHTRLDLVGMIIEEIDGLEAWEILGLNPRWPSE